MKTFFRALCIVIAFPFALSSSANGQGTQVLEATAADVTAGVKGAPYYVSPRRFIGFGTVAGPASATDNAIPRFDGTTGKLLQNSVLLVADTTGALSGFTTGAGVTFHGGGTLTGASGALTLAAGGTAQNIVLTPSTTGIVNTGAAFTATGNITGGNLTTGGLVSATGNVTGGNLTTVGLVSATGNVTGGNLTTGGLVSATGNVTGGNLTTGGLVSATGNITGGNITTAGALSAGSINGSVTLGASGPQLSSSIVARAPSQGTIQDGTSGSTIGTISAFGSTDFSFSAWINPTSYTAARYIIGGAASSFAFYIHTDGKLTAIKMGGAALTASTTVLTAGKWVHVAYTRVDSTDVGTYYVNGIAAGTNTDANDYTTACTLLGSTTNLTTTPFLGTIAGPYPYNRALSAAQVLSLYESGAPAGADNHGVAIGALSPSASLNGYSTAWTTEVAPADTTSFSYSDATESKSGIRTRIPVAMTAGKRYRISFTPTFAQLASLQLYTESAAYTGAVELSASLTSGSVNTFEFVASTTLTGIMFIAGTNATDVDHTFSATGIAVTSIGLLLAPDATATGNGYQLHDVSRTTGPWADITIPATGVTFALPSARGNFVRATLTWAGTHEAKSLLGQVALPSNAVITSIVTTASAGSSGDGLTVGSVTTPALFVAANVYTTAKKVHTLAAQLPAGTATNDLSVVLDPDTANYTGTIQVSINYVLAQ